MTGLVLSSESSSSIEIGEHVTTTVFGMTFNLDTIWSTVVAGTIVVLLGLVARNYLTKDSEDHVPSKLQLLWESVVNEVNTQVEDNLGRVHPLAAPLAIALFFFILIANWLEIIPSEWNHSTGHLLPAPTADTNLTYALAAITIISVWVYGIRQKGVKGYFAHMMEPYPWMLPLEILQELIRPVTLALRLFGNIFAGGIMLSLIALIPWYFGMPLANVVWKLFDMFIGLIQAFNFALLTVIYFAMAGGKQGEHDEEHADEGEKEQVGRREAREEREQQEAPAAV
ncbi:MAG: F0F1 ATP synthase subunit A [Nocardioidaceae bacterium]